MINTVEDLKEVLIIASEDDDELIEQLGESAQDFIHQFCGQEFGPGTFVELFDGGQTLLFLRRAPIASVDSINADAKREFGSATVVEPANYLVYNGRGVIESVTGPFLSKSAGPGTIRVEYSTPDEPVPAAVVRAHVELVAHWYRQIKTQAALEHQNLLATTNDEGTETSRYPHGQSAGFPVPRGVYDLLRFYRLPTL